MAEPDAPADKGGTPDKPEPKQETEAKPDKGADEVEKWKALARKHENRAKELEPLAAKAQELEDAQKTESERLTEALNAAKAEGATSALGLLKLQVALESAPEGLTPTQVAKFAKRLSGSTREEIEADAAEMFAEIPGSTDGPRRPQPTPDQGRTPTSKEDPDAWLREMARK